MLYNFAYFPLFAKWICYLHIHNKHNKRSDFVRKILNSCRFRNNDTTTTTAVIDVADSTTTAADDDVVVVVVLVIVVVAIVVIVAVVMKGKTAFLYLRKVSELRN